MRPTDILMTEHRVIEQVMNCLEKITVEAQGQKKLDAESARQAIDFFKTFADNCHHGKEENLLFVRMEAKGFSRNSGPTGVMLYEHEEGRKFIRGMAETVDAAGRGDGAALERFTQNARGYIGLLRQHIQKEDHCLFAMANQVLGDADQQALLEDFNRVEKEHMGEGTHEKYLALANALAAKWNVPQAQVPAGCGCGHGHHHH